MKPHIETVPIGPPFSLADVLVRNTVEQLARRGRAHVAPVSVHPGKYNLDFPGCPYHIDLKVPQDNRFEALQLSTGAQPPAPAPGKRTAIAWAKSFVFPRAPVRAPQADDKEAPYLRPFRATLAKPATARVSNLTGWRVIDWFLHKLVKVDCTGLHVDARGKVSVEGDLNLGCFKMPLWGFFVPLHRLFRINMNVRTMMDEPLIAYTEGTPEGGLDSKRYIFGLLGRLLGNVHAEMHAPGTIELLPGVPYTPNKVVHDLHFTADGLRMTLQTDGRMDLPECSQTVSAVLPIAIDLEQRPLSPMHVEIDGARLAGKLTVNEPVTTPGTFYNDGKAELTWKAPFNYDDNKQEYFDPEGDFVANAEGPY